MTAAAAALLVSTLAATSNQWGGPPAATEGPPRRTGPDPSELNFFVGARGAVAIPPGGLGVSPSAGIELGLQRRRGLGFGLHLLAMGNPSDAPSLGIEKARWGVGALADMRYSFQTREPLTLFLALSGGFMAGPAVQDDRNVVLPLINPGFGGQIRLSDSNYVACEFGLAAFTVPYVALSFGWDLGPGSDA